MAIKQRFGVSYLKETGSSVQLTVQLMVIQDPKLFGDSMGTLLSEILHDIPFLISIKMKGFVPYLELSKSLVISIYIH